MARKLSIEIVGDSSSAEQALARVAKAGSGFGSKMGQLAKVAAVGAGAMTAALAVGANKAIDAAKNLGESINAVNVVFGKAAPKVIAFGKEAAKSAGLSARAFNELVTPIGAALQNVGFGADQAAQASINLGKRAADMASVFNVDVATAMEAIQAGLRGEADPLERFGVGLSDAAVKAKALSMGLAKTEKDLGANEKAQARLALIMGQTSKLAGDFANTSDQAANKERVLAAERENAAATIGKALVPAYTALLNAVAATVPRLTEFGAALAEKIGPAVESVVAAVREKWPAIQETIGASVASVRAVLSSLAGEVKKVVDYFRDHRGATTALAAALAGLAGIVATYIVVTRTVAAVTKAWAVAQALLNLVMTANPFVLAAVAIIGLAAAMVILYQRSQTVREIVDRAFSAIRSVVTSVVGVLQALWERFGGAITRIASTAFNTLTAIIRSALNIAKGIVTGVLALIQGDWSKAWDSLKLVVSSTLSGIWALLKGAVSIAWTAMKAVGQALIDGILAGVSGLWNALKNKIEGTLKGVLSSLNPFSPVAHGGEKYIGRPLAEGALRGWVLGSASLPEKMAESVRHAVERARAQVEASRGSFSDSWSTLASDALSAFDAITGKLQTKTEKALAKMQAARDKAARDSAVSEARSGLASALAGTDGVIDPEAVKSAQKQLDDALFAQREFAMQQRITQERLELDAKNALRRRHFSEQIAALGAQLTKEGATAAEATTSVLKLLGRYGVDFKAVGASMGSSWIAGLKESLEAAAKKSGALAGVVSSAAKGIKAPPGLKDGGAVLRTGLAVVHRGETFSGVGRTASAGGSRGAAPIVVNVNAGTLVGSGGMRELSEMIRTELIRSQGRGNRILA